MPSGRPSMSSTKAPATPDQMYIPTRVPTTDKPTYLAVAPNPH